ncbi:MAG: hypothetical protein ACLVKI_12705 [Gordonibacter urolithinfaciens]
MELVVAGSTAARDASQRGRAATRVGDTVIVRKAGDVIPEVPAGAAASGRRRGGACRQRA